MLDVLLILSYHMDTCLLNVGMEGLTVINTHAQVPIPQDISALQWLQGQTASNAHCHPLVYFSPRRSSAPDSPSAAAASVASSGAGAVAGKLHCMPLSASTA